MTYAYLRAKSRAVVVSASTALVVVPLSGVAAVALVSENSTPTDSVAAFDAQVAQVVVADTSVVIVADASDDFSLNVPEIAIEVNAPRSTGGGTSSARPVANSADVAQAIAGSSIVAEAAKYVGIKYKAGGKSPDTGFDCSGFVSYVYAQFGYSLPTSSSSYKNIGTRVDSPLPGDIIYTPGHVGIYAGPNLQIDAPRSGKTIQFRSIWQKNPIYIRVS